MVRNNKMDNIKGLLIVFVVFGHMLELNQGYGENKLWYFIIYSFHIPLFAYITGYFAHVNWGKLLKNTVYPYLVFQTAYVLFDFLVLHKELSVSYLTPNWLMWYLFAVAAWNVLLWVVCRFTDRGKLVILFLSFLLALAVGYIDAIGRSYSLSRIIVFFPFFLLGYVVRDVKWDKPKEGSARMAGILLSCVLVLLSIGYLYLNASEMKITWFYEAVSYKRAGSTLFFRLMHMLMALSFIFCINQIMTNQRIWLLTSVGQKTMPIYLMHGFVIKWIGKYHLINIFSYQTLAMLSLSIFIVVLFSRESINALLTPFLRWNALYKRKS